LGPSLLAVFMNTKAGRPKSAFSDAFRAAK
jgi:hypothetical protein